MLSPTVALIALSLAGPTALISPAAVPVALVEPSLSTVIADRSPAMGVVKFVVSFDAGGQTQEIEGEAMALMIDPKGLMVMSGIEIGQRKGASATPKEIKVLLGDDTEGVNAKLIGRDSELDLAWLRIEKPSEKGYTAIEIGKGAKTAVGDSLIGLDKMGKYFDRTPVAFTTVVGGITKKPRELVIPSTPVTWVGLPFFNSSGAFVGMSAVQMPNADSDDEMQSRARERLTTFDRGIKIIPAAEIVSATTRAVEAEKAGKGVGMEEKKEEPAAPAAPASAEPKKDEPVKKD